MRFALLTSLLLVSPLPASASEAISKDECEALASSERHLAQALKRNSETAEASESSHDYSGLASGPLLKKGQAAVEARQRFIAAMKEYADALDDLTAELRACAH